MAKQREIYSGDVTPQQPPPIDLTEYTATSGTGEEKTIQVVEGFEPKEAVQKESFMHDVLDILIQPSELETAESLVPVGVNGSMVYLPRNQPVKVKRMYVERLARAKRVGYRQDLSEPLNEQKINTLLPTRGCQYPFSVIHDPNPNGASWLMKILQE